LADWSQLANLEGSAAIWQDDRNDPGRSAGPGAFLRARQTKAVPAMTLSSDDLAKVALLARLRLSPEELATFTGQLNSIVDYVAQLQELDTSGVEPLAHGVEVRNVFRDDVLGPALPREKALANAPDRNAEAFLVPAVLE
jgi:aspartyl-tRNA(Asn)/glutamyl-tRNA(Gln) amidotransferase subunit C